MGGRSAKPVKVKAGAIASNDAAVRTSVKDKLYGEAVKPEPPVGPTAGQVEIFRFIVGGLAAGEILGWMDAFVLESTIVVMDRLRTINGMTDEDPDLLLNSASQNSRAKHQSNLRQGCSELCLSPQARAKPGGLAAQKAKESRDPLVEVLGADD